MMGDLITTTQHDHSKERKKRLFFYESIFNTTFFQIYLVVRYKHYNFAHRYKERKETTETKAANVSTRTDNDRNEMRAILDI